MLLSMILARSHGGMIGVDGQIPWKLSSDLVRFRRITMGHHVIMGRACYESIGKPLPGRTEIVVTHSTDFGARDGVKVVHSITEALTAAKTAGETEAFIIGGATLYDQTIGIVGKVYETVVGRSDFNGNEYTRLSDRTCYYLGKSGAFKTVGTPERAEKGILDEYSSTFTVKERKRFCGYGDIYGGNAERGELQVEICFDTRDVVRSKVVNFDGDSPWGLYLAKSTVPVKFMDGGVVGYISDIEIRKGLYVTGTLHLVDNDATRTMRALAEGGMEFSVAAVDAMLRNGCVIKHDMSRIGTLDAIVNED